MELLRPCQETHCIISPHSNEIDKDWLVFIQVSLKQYKKHSPNLNALLANKKGGKGYEELPMMIHHRPFLIITRLAGFTDNSRTLYLYASTFTYFNGDCQVYKANAR